MMQTSRTFGPSALATPANALTVIRLGLTPFLMFFILAYHRSWWLVLAWVAMSATDGLDGWVARRQGATTSGAFLDPLADKVLVLGAFGVLVYLGMLPIVPVVLIGIREVGMSIYRSVAGTKGISVPATKLAKAKAWVQDIVVGIAVCPLAALPGGHFVLLAVLWIAVAITLVTGYQYAQSARAR